MYSLERSTRFHSPQMLIKEKREVIPYPHGTSPGRVSIQKLKAEYND